MTWIVTPRQLSARADLYYQLRQLLSAGIGLIEALQIQHRSPPHPSHRAPLNRIIQALNHGSTLGEATLQTGDWVPVFDQALLEAGENSGRLPETFQLLADAYQSQARMLRETVSALAYPVFLIHFAVLTLPFPALFASGDPGPYLRSVLGILIPLYAIGALLHFACRSGRSPRWRAFIEQVGNRIPLLGRARRNLALARLCATLEALVSAGVPLVRGWPLAAEASGSESLKKTVASFRPQLEAGRSPADAISASGAFPDVFANLYNTGELSGQLDDSLKHLQRLHEEEGSSQLQTLVQWTPKLAYIIVALWIGWQVVNFYRGYFEQILENL